MTAVPVITLACAVQTVRAAPAAEATQPAHRSVLTTWLMSLNGSVEFQAESVDVRDVALQDVRIPVKLSDGVAVIDGAAARAGPDKLTLSGRYEFATNDLHLTVDGDGLALPDHADPEQDDGRVFSDAALLPAWLPQLNGGIEFHFDRVALTEIEMTDITLSAAFSAGDVSAKLDAGFANGTLAASFEHEYTTMRSRFDGHGVGIALEQLPLFNDYLSGADAGFEVSIAAHGNTPRALAAHGDAAVKLSLGPGVINNLELDRLTQNLLAMTLWSVLPFKNEAHESRLECAEMRLEIIDGRAVTDRGLVIRTEKLELTGRGSLDLDTEQIALELSPVVNQRFSIAPAGDARTVSIIGSLSEPSLKATAGSLLNESLALGTSWATVPFSRAAGNVLEREKPAPTPCADLFVD